MVDVVVDVVEVVDVVVDVDVEVVAGTVLDGADAEEVDVSAASDVEVEPGLVVFGASLLHEATARTTRTSGARIFGFTVGSLARVVVIT
ncbi:MAG: hypothetical protein QOE00_1080 [Ilumatobacteraceae bacterium]